MTPIEQVCAELLDRQAKRNTLHLNFGSAMRANAADAAPRSHASHEAPTGLRPSGFDQLSQGEEK
jgi:hypothetical protein